jgi:NodT family efflux transporter outer membrane factor (OMF) lipoprotein
MNASLPHRRLRTRLILAATLALPCLFGLGCKVGPDYRTPAVETPARFNEAQGQTTTSATPNPTAVRSVIDTDHAPWVDWWTKFNDPELNSLVARALTANHELAFARARVQEARAVERIAKSALYPRFDLSAALFKTRGSAAGFGFPYGIPGEDSSLFQIGFDATYEVDLFGGVRRTIEAAGAVADATVNERRAVQVTLLGEVARNYVGLRALQRRLVIARANLADQEKTLDVVQRRFRYGLAPNFDQVRAAAQVAAIESSIPPLEAGIRQTMYAIAVLLGEQPAALERELAVEAPIPVVPPTVPVGIPSELLRRRPDVKRAERLLAAATAEQGIATAELFPHLILGATVGVQSREAGDLFSQHDPGSGFYAAGPIGGLTIFDGGRRWANIDRSKAHVAAAAASYEGTVLAALRDVESTLAAYSHDQTRRQKLQMLTTQNQEAVRIAQNEYANGLIHLLDVLEVQRDLYSSQDALAQSDQAVSSDLIAIYKALGGGWEATDGDSQPARAVQ